MHQEAVEEPPSYRASFNPFPALVIGVTGSAMAAHAQVYLFQASLRHRISNIFSYIHQNRSKSIRCGATYCLPSLY